MVLNGLVLDNSMARAYYKLADLYWNQSKLIAAEQIYERALRVRETALGAKYILML